MSVYEYVLQQQPQPSSLNDLEVHECNEALLSNGMRVMEQNFFFSSFRSLKVLRIARKVIILDRNRFVSCVVGSRMANFFMEMFVNSEFQMSSCCTRFITCQPPILNSESTNSFCISFHDLQVFSSDQDS